MRADDRGAGSVLVLTMICLLTAAGLVDALLVRLVVARHATELIAGRTALAAAGARGTPDCGRAVVLARAEGARVRRCAVAQDTSVTVVVVRSPVLPGGPGVVPGLPGRLGRLHATARAGRYAVGEAASSATASAAVSAAAR